MKKWLLLISCLMSCATFLNERPEGRVIERSKQTPPAWSALKLNVLFETDDGAQYRHMRSKERDLPIGIKKTQTDGIQQSYNAWMPVFKQKMLASIPDLAKVQDSDLYPVLEKVGLPTHNEIAQISDFYFEKIHIDRPDMVPDLEGVSEFYEIHVLVTLKQFDMNKATTQMIQALETSGRPELQKIASQRKRNYLKK
jgi:hypothetical protein